MDFIKRILEAFLQKQDDEVFSFLHQMEEEVTEKIVTVHSDPNGYIVFSIFTPEQWSMINDICELTDRDIEDVIKEISEEESIATITVDPKDFS